MFYIMEIFILKEVKEMYQVGISNGFAALENLDNNDVDINGAWKSIRENVRDFSTHSLGH
jgi:hypothetical protein